MPERPIIVFDLNETLLNLDAIRPIFDRIFSDPAAMRLWFANLITYSEALTLAGVYVPFTDIGAAVLQMLAATRGITISDADRAELTARFAAMPPHPEVPAALRRLREHGFRLFTLTDNTLERAFRCCRPARHRTRRCRNGRSRSGRPVRRRLHRPGPGGRRRRPRTPARRHVRRPRCRRADPLGHHRRSRPGPGQPALARRPLISLHQRSLAPPARGLSPLSQVCTA
jgi:hypothetical protein